MIAAPSIALSADPPASAAPSARTLIETQLAMLTELSELGMELARAAGRKALADGDGAVADHLDPALSYSRAARAVRLTIALQSRLMKDLAALEQGAARARSAEAARRRDRIHRHIEQIVEAECDDADEVEQLSSDAWERLTDEDEAALLDRPIEEVVARICQDVGLSPAFAAPAFTAPHAADPAFGPERIVPTDHPDPSSSASCRGSRLQPPPPRQDLEPSLRLAAGFPGQARE